jgi:hypothetical protein
MIDFVLYEVSLYVNQSFSEEKNLYDNFSCFLCFLEFATYSYSLYLITFLHKKMHSSVSCGLVGHK